MLPKRRRNLIGWALIVAAPAPVFAAFLLGGVLVFGRGGVTPTWVLYAAIAVGAATGALGAAVLSVPPAHRWFIGALSMLFWTPALFWSVLMYACATTGSCL